MRTILRYPSPLQTTGQFEIAALFDDFEADHDQPMRHDFEKHDWCVCIEESERQVWYGLVLF